MRILAPTVAKNKIEVDKDEGEDGLLSFTVINNEDGNDTFQVNAINADDAAHKALESLGWWISKN